MEGRFVMLLAGFWCSKPGDFGGKCGEGGGVGIPYFNVGRGRREGVVGDFGLEAISAHDIGFLGVVAGVVGGEGDAAVVIVAEGASEGEAGGVGGAATEGFFACFVRTCSCSLVLLGYLAGQRLQTNASAFAFAIRASSACCCS